MTVDAAVNRWTYIHSLFFLVIGVALLLTVRMAVQSVLMVAAAGLGALSFSLLLGLQGKPAISIPNSISLLRLVLTLLAVPIFVIGNGGGFPAFIVLAIAGLSDLFDGLAARRMGSTRFGAKLDMELDAFFIFMLAAFAHVFLEQGGWVLVAGFLRYGYVFALFLLPDPGDFPRTLQLLSKVGCALAAVALIAVTAPVLGNPARLILCLFSVTVLCVSFCLDVIMRLVLRADGR
jgi:phosphatidylglycerophosphate synthase